MRAGGRHLPTVNDIPIVNPLHYDDITYIDG